MVHASRLVSSHASPTLPEWAVTCSPPAARAATWNCSPTIFGESGTTRSAGAGFAAALSVRIARATLRRAYAGALGQLDAWLAGLRLDDAALAAYLAELHAAGRAPVRRNQPPRPTSNRPSRPTPANGNAGTDPTVELLTAVRVNAAASFPARSCRPCSSSPGVGST